MIVTIERQPKSKNGRYGSMANSGKARKLAKAAAVLPTASAAPTAKLL